MDIPNLRNKSERNVYRNDTACTDVNIANNMLLPTCVSGTPNIDDSIYNAIKQKWIKNQRSDDGYRTRAFNQNSKENDNL